MRIAPMDDIFVVEIHKAVKESMKRLYTTLKTDFGGATDYRIIVEGHLDLSYSGRLAGMTISTTERGDLKPLVTLVGTVRDQAELTGVLDTLYGLHLPIVSVERVAGDR